MFYAALFVALFPQSCPPAPEEMARCSQTAPEGNFCERPPYGLYTDRDSYERGDTVEIHANWPSPRDVKYFVWRIGPLTSTGASNRQRMDSGNIGPFTYSQDQLPPFGSYVEFPDFSLTSFQPSSAPAFTIEAWIYPTYVGFERTCIAGQFGHDGTNFTGTAGIGIDPDGKLFGVARVGSSTLQVTGSTVATGTWTYVALTLTGGRLRLFAAQADMCVPPCLPACVPAAVLSPLPANTGALAASSTPFRIGARADAPGDMTGVFDGRIDRVAVWDVALGRYQLQTRMDEGVDDTNSSCTRVSPPASSHRLLFVDFEDDYTLSTDPSDGPIVLVTGAVPSGSPLTGKVFNHAWPGVAGRPATGHAMGFSRDQVIDAKFLGPPTLASSFTIPSSGWGSSMYVIQAVFEDAQGNYVSDSAENQESEHFCAFILHPNSSQQAAVSGRVAVIVPTFTWMAYNAWPGVKGDESCNDCYSGDCTNDLADWTVLGHMTATGLTKRPDPTDPDLFFAEGNNSIYSSGAKYHVGWRRPSYTTSPILKENPLDVSGCTSKPSNWREAPNDARVFEWLENAPWGEDVDGDPETMEDNPTFVVSYHAFTDSDLHTGKLEDLSRYYAVILLGHAEYWSESMLSRLNEYAECGGNIVSLGGNMIAWRAEFSATNGVLEVKKWPHILRLGDADRHVFITTTVPTDRLVSDNLAGVWRYLLQCQPSAAVGCNSTGEIPIFDYVLGTMADGTGMDTFLTSGGEVFDDFGVWKVRADDPNQPTVPHWLWPTHVPVGRSLTGLGRIVGTEFDAYLDPNALPATPDCKTGDEPTTLQAAFGGGVFPFLASGETLHVLAAGDFSGAGGTYNVLDWSSAAFDQDNVEDLEANLGGGQNCDMNVCAPWGLPDDHGNIVYYKHRGGGRVLSVSAIATPRGLRGYDMSETGHLVPALSMLIVKALLCMSGTGCGD